LRSIAAGLATIDRFRGQPWNDILTFAPKVRRSIRIGSTDVRACMNRQKSMHPRLAATVAWTALAIFPTSAHALGPVDIEIAAKSGVATSPFSTDPTPFGLGIGGRAGIAFLGAYVGASAIYYFGSSRVINAGSAVEFESRSFAYGVEAGYGVKLFDRVTLRPQLGFGSYTLGASFGDQSVNTGCLYLEPAIVGFVRFNPVLVGLDVGVLVLPGFEPYQVLGSSYSSVSVHAEFGVMF
jgi:hypothetical protein